MRRVTIAGLLAATAISTVAVATAAETTVTRVRGYGRVSVQGAEGFRYVVRTAYVVPGSWHLRGRLGGLKRTHRFGPIGSCRIRVTITGAAVADAAGSAVDRVTRLLPGTTRGLLDFGTRVNAAYRVVRTPDRGVDALLVKPAPSVRRQPAPQIVWVELRAHAEIDPRTECHAGGPRTVGTQLGDAFAAARVGGFDL